MVEIIVTRFTSPRDVYHRPEWQLESGQKSPQMPNLAVGAGSFHDSPDGGDTEGLRQNFPKDLAHFAAAVVY